MSGSTFTPAIKATLAGNKRRYTLGPDTFHYHVGSGSGARKGSFSKVRSLVDTPTPLVMRKQVIDPTAPEDRTIANTRSNEHILSAVYGHTVRSFEYRTTEPMLDAVQRKIISIMPDFGYNLKEWVANNPGATYLEKLNIARKIAISLAKLHASGWVHHDMKSVNIMIQHDGNVQLVDFDSARQIGALTGDEHTVFYTAPELQQYYFKKEDVLFYPDKMVADPRYDLYGLGVSLIDLLGDDSGIKVEFNPTEMTEDEFLMGEHFKKNAVSKDNKHIQNLIKQLINPNPQKRPSLKEVVQAIDLEIERKTSTKKIISPSERTVLDTAENTSQDAKLLKSVYDLIGQEATRLGSNDSGTALKTLHNQLKQRLSLNEAVLTKMDTKPIAREYLRQFQTIAQAHLHRKCFKLGKTTLFKHYLALAKTCEKMLEH